MPVAGTALPFSAWVMISPLSRKVIRVQQANHFAKPGEVTGVAVKGEYLLADAVRAHADMEGPRTASSSLPRQHQSAWSGEHQHQEHEAVEDCGLAAVDDRPEAIGKVPPEIGNGHHARGYESRWAGE